MDVGLDKESDHRQNSKHRCCRGRNSPAIVNVVKTGGSISRTTAMRTTHSSEEIKTGPSMQSILEPVTPSTVRTGHLQPMNTQFSFVTWDQTPHHQAKCPFVARHSRNRFSVQGVENPKNLAPTPRKSLQYQPSKAPTSEQLQFPA